LYSNDLNSLYDSTYERSVVNIINLEIGSYYTKIASINLLSISPYQFPTGKK